MEGSFPADFGGFCLSHEVGLEAFWGESCNFTRRFAMISMKSERPPLQSATKTAETPKIAMT